MQSNIETLTVNLKNLENEIKAKNQIQQKPWKCIQGNPITSIRLDPDDFLAFFEFLNNGPHEVKRVPKTYTQNVKPGMKAKLCAKDQFFMYLS